MNLSNDQLNLKITSIAFFILSVGQMLIFRSYDSITTWVYLIIVGGSCFVVNLESNQKNHQRVLVALGASQILYSILVVISFIEMPIAFNNTAQIIYTIGMNIGWVLVYLYVMYHKQNEDALFVLYITTTVLILFKTFSNSTRLIAVVRGYLNDALSIFAGILIVVFTILITLSQFALYFAYLLKVNKVFDLKIEKDLLN